MKSNFAKTLGFVLVSATLYVTFQQFQKEQSYQKLIGPTNDMLKAADINTGKEIAKECAVCHNLEKSGPRKIGPNLYGIVGSHMAQDSGFTYSYALQSRKDQIWTIDDLDQWIKSPSTFIPENRMLFSGLLDPQDRMDVIAYLMTLR